MPVSAQSTALAQRARRAFAEGLLSGLPSVVQAVAHGCKLLASQSSDNATSMKRRDLVIDMQRSASLWMRGMTSMLRSGLSTGMVSATFPGDLPTPSNRNAALALVDDDTIENEILGSRLALAMMDRASWEFTDLRSRMNVLEGREELDANDVFRPHVLARVVIASWRAAGLSLTGWRTLQPILHDEFAHFAEEAYHEINRWLVEHRVMPEIDLRPFIRRQRDAAWVSSAIGPVTNSGASTGH
jgi:Protein of unknown function (DUF1631)